MSAAAVLRFIVASPDSETCFLLWRFLRMRFPNAELLECSSPEALFSAVGEEETGSLLSGLVVHEVLSLDEVATIGRLRQRLPPAPGSFVASTAEERSALRAGATQFLEVDRWLLLGGMMAELVPSAASA